jgi:potassium efflux system protein
MMQKRIFQQSLFSITWLAALLAADVGLAQQRIDNNLAASSQDEAVQKEIDQLREQVPDDNEQLSAEIQEILKRAEVNLAQSASHQQETESNQTAAQGVGALVQSIRQRDPEEPVSSVDWKIASTEVLQRLVQEQTNAANQSRELADQAASALGQRITRRQQIREKLQVVDQALDELRLRIRDNVDGQNWLDQANQLEMRTRIQALEYETRKLNSELQRLDAEDRLNLPNLNSEFLSKQSESRQATLEEMQADLNRRRAKEAAETERETQLSRLGEEPALRASFQKNVKLAEDNRAVAEQLAATESLLKNRKDELDKLKDQYNEAQSRVIEIGLSGSVGAMLRNQKDQLPNAMVFQSNANDEQFSDVQFHLFDVTQQSKSLSEETIREEALQATEVTAVGLDAVAGPISQLTEQRRELLNSAKENFQAQYDKLIELESVESQLADLVKNYRGFINERILWIRSNRVLFSSLSVDQTDRSVLDSGQWSRVGKLLSFDWVQNLWTYLMALGSILTLLLLKPRMRRAVDAFGVEASRGGCSSFWPTAKSLVLSALLAVIVPMILLFIGWRLSRAAALSQENGMLVSALANALLVTSWFAIPMEILKRFCRNSGLGHKHFNWSDEGVATIRSNLNWASPLGSLIVFGVSFFYYLDTRHQNDLIERILFLVGMMVLAIVLHRSLNPATGMLRNYLRQHDRSWANQLRFVWYTLLILAPVTLGLLAVVGYFYTSLNLAACVYMTFVFGLMVETLRALLMRFILVRRRHAHIELARRRRKSLRDEAKKLEVEEQGELAAAVSNPALTDSELLEDFNVDANATQSRKLIGLSLGVVWFLGLWMIWTDVLPALRALDRYPVWPPGATANLTDTDGVQFASMSLGTTADMGTGETVATTETPQSTRITIRDLLVFFLVSMITFVLARNLPGLIEMTFLNHLPVEPSVRYASKSILSYLIVLLGIVLAFRSVQIGWSQVQWLATALTFGLAFGLQEIFANFVAGIILLFERPIRIGDVITVDDVTGVVTKIRTRATTVSNWDRKEYVIPNKEFITGRVLNWTLSDQVNRIVINVGVAYGTNVDAAKKVLLEICKNHPLTVDQPASNVTFEQFADSSLMLTVRTFVPDVDSRLKVIDELHTLINEAFVDAGIEISFPQMDVHFRSADSSLMDKLKN